MKILLKVFGAVFALGLVILLGLHLVMLYGLTKAMRDVVLPKVKQETGIDVQVGRLSINLPNGLLFLDDVRVRNPDGFLLENLVSIERIEVAVDIPSLFKQKPIHVETVEVQNVLINVIRNKAGELNLVKLQDGMPKPPSSSPSQPVLDSGEQPSGNVSEAREPGLSEGSKPLPEMLFEAILCNARIRYVDFKLNQLDIALDLEVVGRGISNQIDPATPWGTIVVAGALGDDRTSFVTDLNVRLAPLTDPNAPSFDLTGKMMEIDPRIMADAYSKMGIRSAPFGIDPVFHCRKGWLEDSTLALSLHNVELEEKLSNRLGGMGTIGSLRFVVPVEGSLQEPVVDVQSALKSAIGGNMGSVLNAFLSGAVAKEAGMDKPPETVSAAAVEILGAHVDEIGESETTKKVLKDLAGGESSATNVPVPINSDTLIDILGEHVDEIGENEALKEDFKQLGNWLFGK